MMKELFTDTDARHGECASESAHFRESARELFTYIRRLAKNHNGFFYAKTPDISRHMKRKFGDDPHFSRRECERLLRIFRVLGIISDWRQERVGKRLRWGRRLFPHDNWATIEDGQCDFKNWPEYEAKHAQLWRETVARTADQTAVLAAVVPAA